MQAINILPLPVTTIKLLQRKAPDYLQSADLKKTPTPNQVYL